jgi:PAS domain S-box-containing protein
MRCKDGRTKHVVIDSSVLWRDGEFVHTRCFTRDVTPERESAETASTLRAIVESSDDAIVSKGLDSVITSWNAGAQRIFGYPAEEAIGRSIRMIIPENRQHEEDEVMATLQRGERVDHFETVRQRKDGSLIDVSVTISPVRDAAGRVVGASKIARDISIRKRAEESLARSVKLKDDFLSLVSHELRTPISIIMGNANVLKRRGNGLDEESSEQVLGDLVSNAVRLQEIIENLLLLSREATSGESYSEPIQVERLAATAVDSFSRRIPEREVMTSGCGGEPIAIGDPVLISLVLDNLLSNAHKYSPEGKPIELAISEQEGSVEISVRDRGIGLREDEMDLLFTPFYRSAEAQARAGGMGLGLAVCKRVLEPQGGRIEARARDGGGSEFVVSLPSIIEME